MANTKQGASAARKREQARKERQQRLSGSAGGRASAPQQNRRRVQRRRSQNPLFWIIGVIVVLAVIVGVFIVLSQQGNNANKPTATDTAVLQDVTHVSTSVIDTVGTGGQTKSLAPIIGGPPLTGPTGKPEFFYMGGEYCPFCAAERWAMVVALSRFGTFSSLQQITSSESSVPTFTFYPGAYKGQYYSSQYIDFVPVESDGQQQGQALQTPTADQQALFSKYDGPPYFSSSGSIPFVDIANQQLLQGANYSPDTIVNLSWKDIAGDLSNANSPVTQGIVGSANYLTAAICQATNQQPGSVCSDATIQTIEQSLGKTSYIPGNPFPGVAVMPEKRRLA